MSKTCFFFKSGDVNSRFLFDVTTGVNVDELSLISNISSYTQKFITRLIVQALMESAFLLF